MKTRETVTQCLTERESSDFEVDISETDRYVVVFVGESSWASRVVRSATSMDSVLDMLDEPPESCIAEFVIDLDADIDECVFAFDEDGEMDEVGTAFSEDDFA